MTKFHILGFGPEVVKGGETKTIVHTVNHDLKIADLDEHGSDFFMPEALAKKFRVYTVDLNDANGDPKVRNEHGRLSIQPLDRLEVTVTNLESKDNTFSASFHCKESNQTPCSGGSRS